VYEQSGRAFGRPGARVYEVEKVRGWRTEDSGPEYFIKWRGFPNSECTWEPEANVDPDTVRRYRRAIDRAQRRRNGEVLSAEVVRPCCGGWL
jgi:hypothetical protein